MFLVVFWGNYLHFIKHDTFSDVLDATLLYGVDGYWKCDYSALGTIVSDWIPMILQQTYVAWVGHLRSSLKTIFPKSIEHKMNKERTTQVNKQQHTKPSKNLLPLSSRTWQFWVSTYDFHIHNYLVSYQKHYLITLPKHGLCSQVSIRNSRAMMKWCHEKDRQLFCKLLKFIAEALH